MYTKYVKAGFLSFTIFNNISNVSSEENTELLKTFILSGEFSIAAAKKFGSKSRRNKSHSRQFLDQLVQRVRLTASLFDKITRAHACLVRCFCSSKCTKQRLTSTVGRN